jgi:hypothetical protein
VCGKIVPSFIQTISENFPIPPKHEKKRSEKKGKGGVRDMHLRKTENFPASKVPRQ